MKVSGQLHAPATISLGNEPPAPRGLEVGWAPEPVWMQWQRQKISYHFSCRKLNPGHPICSLVIVLNEISTVSKYFALGAGTDS